MSRRISKDEIDRFHDYKIYIPTRTLFMGSESVSEDSESGTDSAMAERVIKNIHILEQLNKEPITIIMNNLGGDIYHGLAIYDAIKICESHVTVKILGHAMSMGAIILQAADERLMAPNSRLMIHYGEMGMQAHAKTFQKWAKESDKQDKWMERMFLEKINQKDPHFSLARIKGMLDHDTILDAKESVALGLADKVMGEE